jgi:hypothetical protein
MRITLLLRITSAVLVGTLMLGCGTDPSSVDLTGEWRIRARSHAPDLTEDQQMCTLDMGLIIGSDTMTTAIGGIHGIAAEGDTTGTLQCVLYGELGEPGPRFRGDRFVVTRNGDRVDVYQWRSGILGFHGKVNGQDRMSGVVGPDLLGLGAWVAFRR